MVERQANIERILSRLVNMHGTTDCMIVSKDGEVVAAHMEHRFVQSELAAMVCDLAGMCRLAADQVQLGRPDSMTIQGESGKMFVYVPDSDIGYIFLLGSPNMCLEMSKSIHGEYMNWEHEMKPFLELRKH